MNDGIKTKGFVELTIDYEDGTQEKRAFENTVLLDGRSALASSIAHDFGDSYDFYITKILFGTNGSEDGVPKLVQASRIGLFGPALLSKSVIVNIDPEIPSMVNFTCVVSKSEGNEQSLNEMALRMANGKLYSMATFPDLNKTATMQLTWSWRISFI